MAFILGGKVYQDDGGGLSVCGSRSVVAFESGRAITDAQGLRASDFKIFGDLAAAAEKRRGLSAGK